MASSHHSILGAAVLAFFLCGCGGGAPASSSGSDPPPVSTSPGEGGAVPLVDPFIGTGDSNAPHPVENGSGGSTFPGAALPFGLVQWSPDTPYAGPAGYHFGDGQVLGFSLTHLNGAGCSAKRDFPVFPFSGAWDPSSEPADTFSHDTEIASPGFYEVTLGSGIKVDLTATQRTGLARFTFPRGHDATILVSGGWFADVLQVKEFEATIGDDGTITGHRTNTFFCASAETYTVHFAARFDRPFIEHGISTGGTKHAGATSVSEPMGGVYVGFDAAERRVVHMKIGLSYVSEENAIENLDAENPGWDFDAVHAAAIERWNDYLNRVRIEGGAEADRRAFYSALYHVFLQPGVASDVNGDYLGFDGKLGNASGYTRYADISGWDVYRSWIQLAAVLAPTETSDMMRTMVEAGAECGALPRWPLANTDPSVMVGDPADPILASAHAFGARGFDAQAALGLMVKGATDPAAACNGHVARPGLAEYLARHYCSADGPGSPLGAPAVTLEYAIADFTIARMAGALGDTATQTAFLDRGLYWKNIFDPNRNANGFTGYIEPRMAQDQNNAPVFQQVDVGKNEGFIEGNATQYTFLVPHDLGGLSAALGGDAGAVKRLDSLFTQLNAGLDLPYFYMGNEPEFGTPWEYPFVGAPWRTQDVVRRILTEVFAPTPGGLPGNDDLGATSSWQVWAMLGVYPAVPGVGGFVLGSPLFPKATIALAGGKTLVITGKDAAPDAPYVQSLLVNGAPSTGTWVTWDSVAAGATLDFTLGKTPNQSFGAAPQDRPPSFYP
jgi:predicted alpha-1,2-mannosidase